MIEKLTLGRTETVTGRWWNPISKQWQTLAFDDREDLEEYEVNNGITFENVRER